MIRLIPKKILLQHTHQFVYTIIKWINGTSNQIISVLSIAIPLLIT